MYKCDNCGKTFDEPRKEYDTLYFWGAPVKRYYYVCPYCKEETFEIAKTRSSLSDDE